MRALVGNLEASWIREVANKGMARADVLRFWFGESDEASPEPARRRATGTLPRRMRRL